MAAYSPATTENCDCSWRRLQGGRCKR